MADDTGVGIRLLGGFEATVGGRLVAADAWRLRKAKTLVKLLVLADGHRMHRESLVALLWPDRDTASGINNLHQAPSRRSTGSGRASPENLRPTPNRRPGGSIATC